MTLLTQKTLDTQQAALARALKIVRGIAAVANKASDELCAAGRDQSSRDVGMIAVRLEHIAADLNEVYREARVLEIDLPGGGVITAARKD